MSLPTVMGRLGRWVGRIAEFRPWTNVYGVARSILALGTAITLVATPSTVLFPGIGDSSAAACDSIAGAVGLFCLVPADALEVTQRMAVLLLVVVASGWRPRVTCLLHWWITFSFVASTAVKDGGDRIASNLALLLVPCALTDGRRWHWDPPLDAGPSPARRSVAYTSFMLVRLQVAVVYLHSAISKLSVRRWVDGTAMYYWVHDPLVGAPPWLRPVLFPAVRSPVVTAVLTWGSIALEMALGVALVAPRRWRSKLLGVGIAFHLVIALVIGVTTFSLAMIGALILYLRWPETEFRLPAWLRLSGRPRDGRGPGVSPGLSPTSEV